MIRYFMQLAYNGSSYHGWQIQDNAITVQEEINRKLSLLLRESVNIIGCGRTDTGVHARDFYAHFDVSAPITFTENDFLFKLNSFLSKDIAVYHLWKVPSDFHARFSATSRTYKYYISTKKNPFFKNFSLEYTSKLNLKAMQQASEYILMYNDFTSFSKLHTQTKTNLCKIFYAGWEQKEDLLIFTITADRFLRNMVRAIVGTVLEIGKNKISADEIKNIIEAKNRKNAGFSVPAKGLFLEKVNYPFDLNNI